MLDQTLTDTKAPVKTEQALKELDMKCLQSFYLQPSYRDTKERTPDRIEGTCNWFLSHKDYQQWTDAPEGCLLVSADPGCGKSVLAKYLIDQVLPKSHPDATICYYFFKEQVQERLAPALCAILHQLFSSKEDGLRAYAVPVFEKIGANMISDISGMSDIICKVVENSTARPSTLLVLDALDEIEHSDCRKLFYLLKRLEKISTVKIILTSRPYDQVIMDFDPASFSTRLHIPGEEESEAISTEVSLVVKERLQQLLSRKRIDDQQLHDLQEKLLAETHRTYLFIHLLFNLLETGLKTTQRELNNFFKNLPRSVNEAYTKILNRFADDDYVRKLVRQAFSVLLAAERPLTVREMQYAVKIQISPASTSLDDLDIEDDETFAHKLRNWCGLFIQIFNGKVTFIHQTAREFLLAATQINEHPSKHEIQWGGTFSIEQSHVTLAHICTTYLFLCDRASESKHSRILIPENSDEWDEDEAEFPFLSYAAQHWDLHFDRGRISDKDTICEEAFKLCDPSYNMAQVRLWLSFNSRLNFHEVNPISAGCPIIVPSLRTDALMSRLVATFKAGETPNFFIQGLCAASQYGHIENIRALLDYSGSLQKGESWNHGRAPMHYAIVANRADVIKLLLQAGSPVDGRNLEGQPYLHHAIERCAKDDTIDDEIISAVLESDPDLAATDDDERKNNALHHSAMRGASRALILLLERGADVNAKNSKGLTALHIATDLDNVHQWSSTEAMILGLLKHGASLIAQDDFGNTPLHSACYEGAWSAVILLLAHGATVQVTNSRGETPLHFAAGCVPGSDRDEAEDFIEKQQHAISKLLEHGGDLSMIDSQSSTSLHYAAEWANPEIVGMLIGRGADIEARDKYGKTPLIRAVGRTHGYPAASLLLVLGADVNARDQFGHTAKFYALSVENDFSESDLDHQDFLRSVMFLQYNTDKTLAIKLREVKSMLSAHDAALDVSKTSAWELVHETRALLVKYSSRIDIASVIYAPYTDGTDDVRHCLHLAVQSGFYGWVETLLELGFDPNFSNGSGSPLHHALNRSVAELLLRYGSEVNARDDTGRTPLHYMASQEVENAQRIIGLMIRQGANVNALDHVRATPLHMAVMYGSLENVEYLLKAGADPKLQDAHGFTALSIAAARPFLDTVALLLRNGASTVTSKIQTNPLYCAVHTGMLKNVEYLLAHGVHIQMVAECTRLLISEEPSKFLSRNLHMFKTIAKHHARSVLFELLRAMLRKETDYTNPVKNGAVLLNTAMSIGDHEGVMLLLKCGVNSNSLYLNKDTPLHIAVSHKSQSSIPTQFLIWYGSNVNALDRYAWTPLQLAVHYGSWSNANSLLRSNANPNAQTNLYQTPLHIASANLRGHLIPLLRQYGANPMFVDDEGFSPAERYSKAMRTWLLTPLAQPPRIARRVSMRNIGQDRKYCSDPFKAYISPVRRDSVHFPLYKPTWPLSTDETERAPSSEQGSVNSEGSDNDNVFAASVPLASERLVGYSVDLLKDLRANTDLSEAWQRNS